ncbi:acyl carrier protein [Amycolatopsis samaneae]|uniref:Acyl carrier protein n=1 Tax=Amycolatopsis samaneae TaxID=664691 RepID=A0ABW5GP41_9PSEU
MSGTQAGMTAAQVRAWLIDRVAFLLELRAQDIDPDAELAELGLDSVYAVMLGGEIEEEFGLVVEPTVAWDNPTITVLAGHLAAELGVR